MNKLAQITVYVLLVLSLVVNGVYFYQSTNIALVGAELKGQQEVSAQVEQMIKEGKITVNQQPQSPTPVSTQNDTKK